MRNGIGVMMSCALVLGSLCAVAPARAQDPGDTTTRSETTTTRSTNSPDGSRVETRRTTGNQAATSSAAPAPAPAPARPAEPESDGRASDIVWLEVIGGYSFVNMKQISYADLFPTVVPLSGAGFAAGIAAGVRISFLSIGGRATLASYPGFEVGTAGAEVTLRLPTPVVEPWVRVGFGYGWLGQANYDFPRRSETSVYGYVVQGALGVDVYLGKVVAIGGGFDVDILNMSRQPLPMNASDPPVPPGEVDLTKDGNAVGLQIRGHFAVSFHF